MNPIVSTLETRIHSVSSRIHQLRSRPAHVTDDVAGSLQGVSYTTIYRRRQVYGITGGDGGYITDSELREVLHQLRQKLPSLGQILIWGRL